MEVKKGLILGDFDVIAVLSSVASNPIVLCLCRRFPGSKVSTSTRIRIQIEFARRRVSRFRSNLHVYAYPDSDRICTSTRIRIHRSTQDSSRNIGNRACVVKRTKFASCKMHRRVKERTWERGCHLKYSIHCKELGSILLRHRKKSGFSVCTIPDS